MALSRGARRARLGAALLLVTAAAPLAAAMRGSTSGSVPYEQVGRIYAFD
jgi:hypothetical protein